METKKLNYIFIKEILTSKMSTHDCIRSTLRSLKECGVSIEGEVLQKTQENNHIYLMRLQPILKDAVEALLKTMPPPKYMATYIHCSHNESGNHIIGNYHLGMTRFGHWGLCWGVCGMWI